MWKKGQKRHFGAGRKCQVCISPDRYEIELCMAGGGSRRSVGERFPDLSADSIYRHWTKHVPDHVKIAKKTEILKPGAELKDLVEGESIGLLGHLQRIRKALYLAFDTKAALGDAQGLVSL